MTVKDYKLLLEQYIGKWIGEYATSNNIDNLIINFTGTCNDYVLIESCLEANKVINLSIDVFYQKHSEHILKDNIKSGKLNIRQIPRNINNLAMSYLFCRDISDKGIVIGSVDKTYGKFSRSYSKLAEYTSDIFPLYDLKYSDIYYIARELYPSVDFYYTKDEDEYRMLEWCFDVDNKYSIITNQEAPHKNKRWPYFTQIQKEWIGKIHQREKQTRHKIINKPFLSLKDNPVVLND